MNTNSSNSAKDRVYARMRERQNELRSKRGSGVGFFTPKKFTAAEKDGVNIIRVVKPPYIPDDQEPWIHTPRYVIPLPGGRWYFGAAPYAYGCEDPIADYRETLANEGPAETTKEARKEFNKLLNTYSAKDSFIMLVVDIEKPQDGLQVFQANSRAMDAIFDACSDPEYRDYLAWDPVNGYNIRLRHEDGDYGGEWTAKPARNNSPLPNASAIIAQAAQIDLTRFIVVDTPETLLGVLDGKFDREEAKKARQERDRTTGRPVPAFLDGDDSEGGETDDGAPSRDVPAAPEPPVRAVAVPERKAAAPKPEPKPEPVVPDAAEDEGDTLDDLPMSPMVGQKVEFEVEADGGASYKLSGIVKGATSDAEMAGCYDVEVVGFSADLDGVYAVSPENMTIVEEPKPAPKPAPAAPKPAPKPAPAAPKPAPKPAPAAAPGADVRARTLAHIRSRGTAGGSE